MRISENDFDEQIKTALAARMEPSPDFEARLFSSANALLEKRRELAAHRRSLSLFEFSFDFPAFFAPNPLARFAVVLAALVLVVVTRAQSRKSALILADLPEFPKTNNATASYDAQWLAERNAYDKEIENAQ